MNESPLLRAENIAKGYPSPNGRLEVLRDVTLTLCQSESMAIMGPSGSGKSTLLNILGTLDAPSAGRLTLVGQNPFALSERELARFRNRHIGFVFQDHHLLPQCSVLENVLIPTLPNRSSADAGLRANELLERVGLGGRATHRPAQLSGGEKQRTAIARALINRPSLILADEPTGNLDRRTARDIAALLAAIVEHEETGLIIVTHSEEFARHCGRRYEVVDGSLVPWPAGDS